MSFPILYSPKTRESINLTPAIAGQAIAGMTIVGNTASAMTRSETWDSLGLGVLSDTIRCEVVEVINGAYEIELEYPPSGIHYDEIKNGTIIFVKVPYADDPQAFRVYQRNPVLTTSTVFYARHLSYDLCGYPVSAFSTLVTGITAALNSLISNALVAPTGFSLTTDKTNTTTSFRVTECASIRSWFGGREGSILDKFGGEWEWNNFVCKLCNRRGSDKGYTIRYAKNLTALSSKINNEKTYTGVICVYTDADGNTVASAVQNTGVGILTNILTVDVTSEYASPPSVATLNARAQAYISAAGLNAVDETSISLTFIDLPEQMAGVALGDTVKVICDDIDFSSRIIEIKWDVIKERYIEMKIGKVQATLSDSIHSVEATVDKTETRNVLKIDSSGWIVNRPLNADADMTVEERGGYKNPEVIRTYANDLTFLDQGLHYKNRIADQGGQMGGITIEGVAWHRRTMDTSQTPYVTRNNLYVSSSDTDIDTSTPDGPFPSRLVVEFSNVDIYPANNQDGSGATETNVNVHGNLNVSGVINGSSGGGGGTSIDDSITSLNSTWSSSKISSLISRSGNPLVIDVGDMSSNDGDVFSWSLETTGEVFAIICMSSKDSSNAFAAEYVAYCDQNGGYMRAIAQSASTGGGNVTAGKITRYYGVLSPVANCQILVLKGAGTITFGRYVEVNGSPTRTSTDDEHY